MKKTKIAALALALFLSATTFAGCESNDTKNPSDEISSESSVTNDTQSGAETTETAATGLSAYEWRHADDEIIFSVGGREIPFDIYRYYAMNYKPMYDNSDNSYWNEETEAQFKNDMILEVKKCVAIEKLCEEKGITLSEQELSEVAAYLDEFKAIYGEEVYNQQMDLGYFTKDVYVEINSFNLLLDKLYRSVATDDKVSAYADENYVHVKHVLVSTLDEEGKEYTGAELEEKTALANEIAKRARDGEDFDELVKQYGEDPGMESTPEGYTFTYGTMVEEFEKVSYAIAVGDISDPVKTSYGYHIIQRLPIDKEALLDNTKQTYWEIVSAIAAPIVEPEVSALAESLEVSETEGFKTLTAQNIGVAKK